MHMEKCILSNVKRFKSDKHKSVLFEVKVYMMLVEWTPLKRHVLLDDHSRIDITITS